jgi:hypothetical protein
VRHASPQRARERCVAAGGQPRRDERRHRPVLPTGTKRIGRRAHRDARGELILRPPGVEPGRIEAHRQVVDQPQPPGAGRAAAGRGQLLVQQPLQVGVVADLMRVGRAPAGQLRRGGVAKPGRPGAPVTRIVLLQSAEAGERLQVVGRGPPGLKRGQPLRPPGQRSPARPQRLVLAAPHGDPVEQALAGQATCDRGQRGQPLPLGALKRRSLRHRIDAQIQRAAKQPAGGVVGTVVAGRRGVQWVQQHEPRPVRPGGERGQVAQVADPPALARTQPIELRRPATGAPAAGKPTRQMAGARRDHQGGLPAWAHQAVPAQRQVTRQPRRRCPLLAGLQHQQRAWRRRLGGLPSSAGDHHRRQSRDGRRVRIHRHGLEHRRQRLRRDLAPASVGEAEPAGDPVRLSPPP